MLLNRLTCTYKYLKVYFSLAIQYVCSRDIIFFSATEKQSPTLVSRVNIYFQPPEKKYLASTVHRVHKKNRPDFSLWYVILQFECVCTWVMGKAGRGSEGEL